VLSYIHSRVRGAARVLDCSDSRYLHQLFRTVISSSTRLRSASAANQSKMERVPYWIDSEPIKPFPRLQKNVRVDLLVVGAGITGITASYLLKKAGLSVALIERERVASIDTGHTTAHLTYVTDVELQELARNFGN